MLLYTSISIIYSSSSQSMRSATTKTWRKVYKPCFSSSLVSLSCMSCSLHHLRLSSLILYWPLYTQTPYTRCIKCSQNLKSMSIVFYCSHSPYTQCTKPWQTWMACQSYFIILIVCTCEIQNQDRVPPVWGSCLPQLKLLCLGGRCACLSTPKAINNCSHEV